MAAVARKAVSTPAVSVLASDLLLITGVLAPGVAEHLDTAISELAAIEDDEFRAELLASTEANGGQRCCVLLGAMPERS